MQLCLTVKELKELLPKSETALADSVLIKSIASLENASRFDIAIIIGRGEASAFDAVSPRVIERCAAGIIIAEQTFGLHKPFFIVPDALEAFNVLVRVAREQCNIASFVPSQHYPHALVDQSAQVHAMAQIGAGTVIEQNTVIGENTWIAPHVFIGKRVTIGNGVQLHPGVVVLDDCTVGDGSIIHAGTVIGSDGFGYKVTMNGLLKIPQIGIVTIGNYVEIGANCSIDRASFDATVINDFVKIDNGVHIAHNVSIGPATAILAQTGIAGRVRIGMGCQIGGQVAIKDGITIGNRARIVSKSAVMHNVADGATVAGIPAISFSLWKRVCVILTQLPTLYAAAKKQQTDVSVPSPSLFKKVFHSWLKR